MLDAMSKVKDPSRLLLAVRFVETMVAACPRANNEADPSDHDLRQIN
jgi:hypothetical protein